MAEVVNRGWSRSRDVVAGTQTRPAQAPTTRWESINAAMWNENVFLSAIAARAPHMIPMEGYNPLADDPEITERYPMHLDIFARSRSPEESAWLKRRIEQERLNNLAMSANPGSTMLGAVMAGMTSPESLIPYGTALRVGASGAKIGKALYRGAAAGMAAAGTAELALHATQIERTPTESFTAIAGAGIISGLLSGASSAFGRGVADIARATEIEKRVLRQAVENELEEGTVGTRVHEFLPDDYNTLEPKAKRNALKTAIGKADPDFGKLLQLQDTISGKVAHKIVDGMSRVAPEGRLTSRLHSVTARALGLDMSHSGLMAKGMGEFGATAEGVRDLAVLEFKKVRSLVDSNFKDYSAKVRADGSESAVDAATWSKTLMHSIWNDSPIEGLPKNLRVSVELAMKDVRMVLDEVGDRLYRAGFISSRTDFKGVMKAYAPTSWRIDRIASEPEQFKAFLKTHFLNGPATKKQELAAEQAAQRVLDRLLSYSSKDLLGTGIYEAGAFKEITLRIPRVALSEAGWISNDIHEVLEGYSRMTVGRLALAEKYGTFPTQRLVHLMDEIHSIAEKFSEDTVSAEREILIMRWNLTDLRVMGALGAHLDPESDKLAVHLEELMNTRGDLTRRIDKLTREYRRLRDENEGMPDRPKAEIDRLLSQSKRAKKRLDDKLSSLQNEGRDLLKGIQESSEKVAAEDEYLMKAIEVRKSRIDQIIAALESEPLLATSERRISAKGESIRTELFGVVRDLMLLDQKEAALFRGLSEARLEEFRTHPGDLFELNEDGVRDVELSRDRDELARVRSESASLRARKAELFKDLKEESPEVAIEDVRSDLENIQAEIRESESTVRSIREQPDIDMNESGGELLYHESLLKYLRDQEEIHKADIEEMTARIGDSQREFQSEMELSPENQALRAELRQVQADIDEIASGVFLERMRLSEIDRVEKKIRQILDDQDADRKRAIKNLKAKRRRREKRAEPSVEEARSMGIDDPEGFVDLARRVRRAEKETDTKTKDPVTGKRLNALELMDQLESEGKPRDGREFSERRGYTEAEIRDFEEYVSRVRSAGLPMEEMQDLELMIHEFPSASSARAAREAAEISMEIGALESAVPQTTKKDLSRQIKNLRARGKRMDQRIAEARRRKVNFKALRIDKALIDLELDALIHARSGRTLSTPDAARELLARVDQMRETVRDAPRLRPELEEMRIRFDEARNRAGNIRQRMADVASVTDMRIREAIQRSWQRPHNPQIVKTYEDLNTARSDFESVAGDIEGIRDRVMRDDRTNRLWFDDETMTEIAMGHGTARAINHKDQIEAAVAGLEQRAAALRAYEAEQATDMTAYKWKVEREHAEAVAKVKPDNTRERAKINRQSENSIKDIEMIRDRIAGVSGIPKDPTHLAFRAERTTRKLAVVTMLNNVALSSLPDLGMHVFVNGSARNLRGLKRALTDKGFREAIQRDEMVRGMVAAETVAGANRFTKITDIGDPAMTTGPVEGLVDKSLEFFGKVTGIEWWNRNNRAWAAVMIQDRIIGDCLRWVDGNLHTKDINNLRVSGINEEVAFDIVQQWRAHGESEVVSGERFHWSKSDKWSGETRRAFQAAVVQDVNRTIIVPGVGEQPRFMSMPFVRLLGTFKSFAFAANTKVMGSGLQRMDANVLSGGLAMVAIGAGVYALRQWIKGKEISDDPRVWAFEAVDRSGVTGMVMDLNNMAEAMSGGRIGLPRLLGADASVRSRYDSRTQWDAALGPVFGLTEKVLGTATAPFKEGGMVEADYQRAASLLPYSNHWAWDLMFKAMGRQ